MIIAAAIQFTKDNKTFIIMGKRHGNCFETAHACGLQRPFTEVQGFMTDKFEFMDRVEAKKYARAHNQIVSEEFADCNELFSEDLW